VHAQDDVFQMWLEQGQGPGGRDNGAKKGHISYNEKELREAAALEVAEKRAREKSDGGHSSDAGGGGSSGSRKKHTLTAEEKAAQSRYRNREHARNTRLRKKAYMKKLKELVDELERQRKEEARTKEIAAAKLSEQQNYRKSVVTTFLHLRATNDKDRGRWSQVLEPEAVLTLPVTPYRYFLRSEAQHSSRILNGVDAMMCDAASLQVRGGGGGSGMLHETIL
jgi:hypothetical protein